MRHILDASGGGKGSKISVHVGDQMWIFSFRSLELRKKEVNGNFQGKLVEIIEG